MEAMPKKAKPAASDAEAGSGIADPATVPIRTGEEAVPNCITVPALPEVENVRPFPAAGTSQVESVQTRKESAAKAVVEEVSKVMIAKRSPVLIPFSKATPLTEALKAQVVALPWNSFGATITTKLPKLEPTERLSPAVKLIVALEKPTPFTSTKTSPKSVTSVPGVFNSAVPLRLNWA